MNSSRLWLPLAAALLSACEGSVTLGITDAPIDSVDEVVVRITRVTFNTTDGNSTSFDVPDSAQDVPISQLSDGVFQALISGEELPTGSYNSVDLEIDADNSVQDSYIELDDGTQVSLVLAAGADLRARGSFEVEDDESLTLIVELDLRQSLTAQTDSNENRILDPVMRLVVESESGSVVGIVDSDRLTDASCDNGEDNNEGNVVYVYEGNNVTPDDLDGNAPFAVTTQAIRYDATTDVSGRYTVAFLEAGNYTLALSCQGLNDDPSRDDAIAFFATRNVTVTAGQSVTVDF